MPETKGVEAVDRALTILQCFSAATPENTLKDIAEKTGFYKSTILRLAVSLERFGFLIRADSGEFRLGPATWRLGAVYQQGFDLEDIIRPELKQLSAETNETASFFVREGDSRICLFRVEPSRAIRHTITEGESLPLDVGASGKVLSAYSGEDSPQAIDQRADGFSTSLGERDKDVAAISVPLHAEGGRLVGAVAVSGLITRFDPSQSARILAALKQSQERLQRQISN